MTELRSVARTAAKLASPSPFQTVYDPFFISTYNLFYTSLPVLCLGIMDQDVDDYYSRRFPKLYTPGHHNVLFNKRVFMWSAVHGAVTSFLILFIPYGESLPGLTRAALRTDSHWLTHVDTLTHHCILHLCGIFTLTRSHLFTLSRRICDTLTYSSASIFIKVRAMIAKRDDTLRKPPSLMLVTFRHVTISSDRPRDTCVYVRECIYVCVCACFFTAQTTTRTDT